MHQPTVNPQFPTTHWSLVQQAGQAPGNPQRQALVQLLGRYLPPMRFHLIHRKRIDPHRADDLLQDFLADKVLEDEIIRRYRRERGKFRTFLLMAIDRFLIDKHRHHSAKVRSEERVVPLDAATPAALPTSPAGDEAFDAEWASQLLTQALDRMKQECLACGREDVWGMLDHRILRPLLNDEPAMQYDALVRRFGLRSPAQASNLLMTAKRMLVRTLRNCIAEYEADPARIEEEIADLRRALSRSGSGTVRP